MKNIILLFLCSCIAYTQNSLSNPTDFLPLYGKQVTFYHEVENYFEHLCTHSPLIKKVAYGITPQGRELATYVISTQSNLEQLEHIRLQHLSHIDLAVKKELTDDKAIVWLSFNVHGNEIGAIESALSIAFDLVNPANKETKKWLEDVIVILDPCLNPDGFSRYAQWLRDISSAKTHPEWYDREHMEPWPGGRQNHYVFDLNRDWAWQTQSETQQRMALYKQWMPMVHVDVHEMGYNDPYFFPPAAEPFHEQISNYQRLFHQKIGEHTAKKFDAEGWLYYTAERFDLFYPSYGDTYPSFNGAIGMTYEQGGIGAGRAVKMKNGQILTLQDRIEHHQKAVLAAVELSFLQKDTLINSFRNYFSDNRKNPKGKYQTYVIKKSAKTKTLLDVLSKNGIEFQTIQETKKLRGFDFEKQQETDFQVDEDDIAIQVDQPRSVLTQVLFEPYHFLKDSLSYDITSWALPWAHGVETYALKSKTLFKTKALPSINTHEKAQFLNAYGYYVPWNSRASSEILSQLHQQNVKVRMVMKAKKMNGFNMKPGDLLITKADNQHLKNLSDLMYEHLLTKEDVQFLNSGLGNNGGDFGGENYQLLKAPKVLLLSGESVKNIDFGQVWFYMDQVVKYPVSIVDVSKFNRLDLNVFNTIILPSGYYGFNETNQKKLNEFVRNGGKIIAIDEALSLFEDNELFSLKRFPNQEQASDYKKKQEQSALENRISAYENEERQAISEQISGAIIENKLDVSHPLAFGLGNTYYSLKTTDKRYQLLKDARNVIYVPQKFKSSGFIGHKIKSEIGNTVSFAVENKGNGVLIYMVDNPLFRGFWENGNQLFSNALFLVN